MNVKASVPDPKLIISDPDPQIENQEFRILEPDPSLTRDSEKIVVNFGYYEDKYGSKSLTF